MRTSVPGVVSWNSGVVKLKPLAASGVLGSSLGRSLGSSSTGAAGLPLGWPAPTVVSSNANALWPNRPSTAAATTYLIGLIAGPRRLLQSDSYLCSPYILLGTLESKPPSTPVWVHPAIPQQSVPETPCHS